MDWEGRCDWRSNTPLTHRMGLLPDAVTTLHCVCSQGQRKAAFSISDEWRPAGGGLLIDGQTLQLHLQDVTGHEVNLASTAPAFLVRGEEDQLLAAVDTFRPGRVWRHRGLPADTTEPNGLPRFGTAAELPELRRQRRSSKAASVHGRFPASQRVRPPFTSRPAPTTLSLPIIRPMPT